MTRPDLSQTLTALIEGATPHHDQMAIEHAEITLPLLVRMEASPDGPVFTAHPPFSAFHSGFEPVAHRTHLRIEPVATQDATPATPAAHDPTV